LRYLLEKAIDATASTIAPRFTLLYKTFNKLCVYNIMHTEYADVMGNSFCGRLLNV